ncbi:glycoside hydrolase family 3 protein [Mucilaginibacter arboris]|uniref:beta-N-acetylhexosaminidase n=1 Tax=Mucilaginibacter arboris TaxID=2682090 RepID=A0A7K1SZX7_9SPHI|nr:glycoside hydrolase family 3 N-terminal domain-containing protein [Mucilaginibacter arboris]MVN22818.1 glycoside hydrolase family 3 [Mucilaginibacter arboris]
MPNFTKKLCFISLLLSFSAAVFAQTSVSVDQLTQQNHWVDSVFRKLNRHDRVAQLLMVRAHTNLGKAYEDSVAKVVQKEHVGGLVFFQGGPGRQAALTNRYQKLSRVPLLIAMDGEWGLGMRLDSTISYPYQMTLGAIRDNGLIYKMGQFVARDFKRLGMQMNFAPDMDVNNNPNNPVIGFRSFGDNKINVAQKGIAYLQGMQSGGILTTAKHFPGHGDTDVDSHMDLPLLPFSRERLDSLEMYPFKEAAKAGITGIMVAHMNIPALDTTAHLPSTLSRPIITGILKEQLGFKGLVVSDAMEMKGVVKYFPNSEADVLALNAGNDILELTQNSVRAVAAIRKAIRKGTIDKKEFFIKVKKVLAAKYAVGLNHFQEVPEANLYTDLNSEPAKNLNQQLTDAAVTLLKGDTAISRLNFIRKTALLAIGTTQITPYQIGLQRWFANNNVFFASKTASAEELNQLLAQLKTYDQVIAGVFDTRTRPYNKLDYNNNVKAFVTNVAALNNSVISVFANPYTIATINGLNNSRALIVGYQNSPEMQQSAVKVISRQLKPTGTLPVNINASFIYGMGIVAR